MSRLVPTVLALAQLPVAAFPVAAHAQYAEPPDETAVVLPDAAPRPVVVHDEGPPPPPLSTIRLITGPAIRFSDSEPKGGVSFALDIGQGAAGARLSGTWLSVGQPEGLASYTGELWLDFSHQRRLHPQLGAGGGLARLERLDEASDDVTIYDVGVGHLRAGLHHALPLRNTDARAGFDLTGYIPAIHPNATSKVDPWLVAMATVMVGF